MMVSGMTMEPTYTVQIQHRDGSWSFYSGGEYTTEQEARALAAQVYGGQVPTRIVKIERSIVE